MSDAADRACWPARRAIGTASDRAVEPEGDQRRVGAGPAARELGQPARGRRRQRGVAGIERRRRRFAALLDGDRAGRQQVAEPRRVVDGRRRAQFR
jgi:hypothetical protein